MKDRIRKLLCWLGLHANETVTFEGLAEDSAGRKVDLHYSVCKFCSANDPRITGEWI